jgi:hypothetical protein
MPEREGSLVVEATSGPGGNALEAAESYVHGLTGNECPSGKDPQW